LLKFEGFNKKGELTFDYAYPGICGIKNYELFWECLEEILSSPKRKNLSDCDVINKMVEHYYSNDEEGFHIVKLRKWYDIGNVSELERTRENFKESFGVLDKPRENVYFHNGFVVKFFHDKELVRKRVKRCEFLKGLVPKLVSSTPNFFKYEFVEGELFASSATPAKMKTFLSWASKNMWDTKIDEDISSECYKFYFEKTQKRVLAMLDGERDSQSVINGEAIPTIEKMLSLIDKEWLCKGVPGIIHGDLILDNVIETNSGFVLIDWRQDFAGRVDIGDVYYDLAKLNHNLIFNHELVTSKKYTLEDSGEGILCDILCRKNLLDCKEVLDEFIQNEGYDLSKVRMITSLVWINMSPLHEHPLDKFLFNFGKYNLFRSLKKRGAL
jgi:hypothetical protein